MSRSEPPSNNPPPTNGHTAIEITGWLDPDLTAWISIRCPRCRVVHEHRADELPLGHVLQCDCGAELVIEGDFPELQAELKRGS